MMAQPGDVLAERWTLAEKIDAGAMGEIFRGHHLLLGHAVAIKVMMPEIARDAVAIERFLREAKIAARLQHRHVVRVEDYGLARDGRPFLVMELLDGESLARRLIRTPRLPPREVLAIVRQIALALDTAHGAGIVHRDLKPENIFLVDDPDAGSPLVKVLDFGVAKFTDALAAGGGATTSNTLIGTPRYMSPEQARSSRELDGRSDLWALGMLTYEMLTGRHPFDGEAIAEILVAILTHPVPPPTTLVPELPSAVDAWMARAVARNKSDRFSTARSMALALEQALDGNLGDWAPRDHVLSDPSHRPRRTTLKTQRPHDLPDLSLGVSPDPVDGASQAPLRADESGRMAVSVSDPAVHPFKSQRSNATRATVLAGLVAVLAGLGLATVARFTPHRAGHPRTALAHPLERPPVASPGVPVDVPSSLAVPVAVPVALPASPAPPGTPVQPSGPSLDPADPNPRNVRGGPTVRALEPARSGLHRPRSRPVGHVQQTPTGGGEYDPPGI